MKDEKLSSRSRDEILHLKRPVPLPAPKNLEGLELEKFTANIRLETRKDCLARIEGRTWTEGEITEVSDGHCVRSYLIDRDTLIRVLGLGMAR